MKNLNNLNQAFNIEKILQQKLMETIQAFAAYLDPFIAHYNDKNYTPKTNDANDIKKDVELVLAKAEQVIAYIEDAHKNHSLPHGSAEQTNATKNFWKIAEDFKAGVRKLSTQLHKIKTSIQAPNFVKEFLPAIKAEFKLVLKGLKKFASKIGQQLQNFYSAFINPSKKAEIITPPDEIFLPEKEKQQYLTALNLSSLNADTEQAMADVRKAFKKQSLLNHPDRGGDENKMKSIGQAHEKLFQYLADKKVADAFADLNLTSLPKSQQAIQKVLAADREKYGQGKNKVALFSKNSKENRELSSAAQILIQHLEAVHGIAMKQPKDKAKAAQPKAANKYDN